MSKVMLPQSKPLLILILPITFFLFLFLPGCIHDTKTEKTPWATWNVQFKENTTEQIRELLLYTIQKSLIDSVNILRKDDKQNLDVSFSLNRVLNDSLTYQIKMDFFEQGGKSATFPVPPPALPLDALRIIPVYAPLDSLRPVKPYIKCINLNQPCS